MSQQKHLLNPRIRHQLNALKNKGFSEDLDMETILTIKMLDLSANIPRPIEFDLGIFLNLHRLILTKNLLSDIPLVLAKLPRLSQLNLSKNPLGSLGVSGVELKKLSIICLSESQADIIPRNICHMEQLNSLIMNKTLLSSIPFEIAKLQMLTFLDLSHNRISVVPQEIYLLQQLVWLNLGWNKISDLPHELGYLSNLQDLGLVGNNLTCLPDLSRAVNLKYLHVSRNKLMILGDWLMELKNIILVDASHNQLMKIPREIFFHLSLKYLLIDHNNLSSLPHFYCVSYDQSGKLQVKCILDNFDVSFNQLGSLPWQISLIEFKQFFYDSNPWLTLEILQQQNNNTNLQQSNNNDDSSILSESDRTQFLSPGNQEEILQTAQENKYQGQKKIGNVESLRIVLCNYFLRQNPLFANPLLLHRILSSYPQRLRNTLCCLIFCDFCEAPFVSETGGGRKYDDFAPILLEESQKQPHHNEQNDDVLEKNDNILSRIMMIARKKALKRIIRHDAIFFRRLQNGHEMPLQYIFCSEMCKKMWTIRTMNHIATSRSRFQPRDI